MSSWLPILVGILAYHVDDFPVHDRDGWDYQPYNSDHKPNSGHLAFLSHHPILPVWMAHAFVQIPQKYVNIT